MNESWKNDSSGRDIQPRINVSKVFGERDGIVASKSKNNAGPLELQLDDKWTMTYLGEKSIQSIESSDPEESHENTSCSIILSRIIYDLDKGNSSDGIGDSLDILNAKEQYEDEKQGGLKSETPKMRSAPQIQ